MYNHIGQMESLYPSHSEFINEIAWEVVPYQPSWKAA